MNFLNKILSFIYPKKCTFCSCPLHYKNNTFICDNCMHTIPFIEGATCVKCSSPREMGSMPVCNTCRKFKHPFSGSFTPLIYEGKVRKSIVNLKFYNKESYCRSFAYLISNRIIEKGFPNIDFITYIPLSSDGYDERGFNQCKLIAHFCSEILHLPVKSTLYRINGTPKQSTLSASERRKNAKRSFFPKNEKLFGTALLIDDIYTTGSTLSHCSSLLLKMGCDKVYIATVALKNKK